jgi:hypothetical protein
MAATTITVQSASRTGLTPTYASANTDGSYFANNGRTFLQVKNTNASPATVSITPTAKFGGRSLAQVDVVIPATSGDKLIGPFPTELYNDAQGRVFVSYSAVTSLTVAAVRLESR